MIPEENERVSSLCSPRSRTRTRRLRSSGQVAANETHRQEKIIMRTITPDRTKSTSTPLARGFGKHNLWDLWLLDEAEEVPCGSIRTFLHYLCSEGTTY